MARRRSKSGSPRRFRSFNEKRNRPYRLSASIGLVQVPVAEHATVDDLLARADELMYAEKRSGMTRVSST